MMKRKRALIVYIIGDWLMAALTWTSLFLFRKVVIQKLSVGDSWLHLLYDSNYALGIFFVPLFWLVFFFLSGFYKDVYRKSRLTEVWRTFLVVLFGSIVLFFGLILDDVTPNYQHYYRSFLFLALVQYFTTITWRMVLTSVAKYQLKNRIVTFPTLIIGSNEKAIDLYHDLEGNSKSLGYEFVGFIEVNGEGANGLKKYLSHLGNLQQLKVIITRFDIEEVIVAIESSEHDKINRILNKLSDTDVVVKIIPDLYDVIIGTVRVSNVFGAPLIEIYPDLMQPWQRALKRIIDIVVSFIVLVVLSPLYLFLMLRVKLSSPGPVIYKQERIGLRGESFNIYKFRSMYQDAEQNGPQLSSENDERVTPWGRIMRKWRLDELPQFYNVLKGEMSLVGPRPERPYFTDKIVKRAPHYKHLHKVKPGITSLGMVKFGYASTLEQMIKRMKYDILYIENMSLALDFKVMLFTLYTIIQGQGR